MERRLLKIIINPAMIVVWLTGLWMAYASGFFQAPWLHAKLTLVLAMSALHGYFAASGEDFRRRQELRPGAILPDSQRNPARADGDHRGAGRGQTVLTKLRAWSALGESEGRR